LRGLVQGIGGVLVLAVLQDAFFTVLFPASGHGVVRRPLSRWTWACFAGIGRRLPKDRRRALLTYSGPVQVLVSLGAWIVLLVVGWAMVFQPALGSGITVTADPHDRSWATAVYYSGYVLTTLGLGDVTAQNGLYRLLTVVEAVVGFATVTMAITYFLSVYSALTERKVSAALLHHRSYDTGDAATLLAGQARDGELPGAGDQFDAMAQFVQRALETHVSYPVLRYFHQRRTCYALPRILLLALDSVSLLRTVLDPERYRALIGSPSVAALDVAAGHLLTELVPRSLPGRPTAAEEQCWRQRLCRAAERLQDAGLALRPDLAAAADAYVAQRSRWATPLRTLADAMAYDWSDIEPAHRGG
jgi:hypothetical protein